MKLGRHGHITAEQARTLAIQALAEVSKSNDPLEDRNSARKAISVKELCELYIAGLEAGLIFGKGGRRGEIKVRKTEIDAAGLCYRFEDTQEGQSVRPIGLPVLEYFDERGMVGDGPYIFPSERNPDEPFGSFPGHWEKIFADTELSDLAAHLLRHSFASIANDLGFTEITIAALLGHTSGSITSRYVHTLDAALIMAADTVSGYIQALLDGAFLSHTHYALDRSSRKAALAQFLSPQSDSLAPA